MEKVLKTGYEWCLEAKLRILNLVDWDSSWPFYEDSYYKEKIDAKTFYERIAKCNVKPNSTPRKTEMYLEYRMYGLVPYNISEIQRAIQFGHAVVRYGRMVKDINPTERIYNKWADEDETFIILNGGTTNKNPEKLGSLNQHLKTFIDNEILVKDFYEPDLGDQLTAFCFLVDERVFNKEVYPDFIQNEYPWPRRHKPSEKEMSKWEGENKKNYDAWVEKIGGVKNAFLREYLRPMKLA